MTVNSVKDELPLMNQILEGLAKHFGINTEFVIHDYTKDYGKTIVSIQNGTVTGRAVGGGGTDIGLRVLQGEEKEGGKFNYLTQTKDGRYLRSSTVYFTDPKGKPIGSFCINSDITEFISTRNLIDNFINLGADKKLEVETVVFDDVEDLLISMINESISIVGTPVALMTRQQKIDGIRHLKDRGAFKIQNAGNVVAKYYGISKYTIYNYINESKASGNGI